MDPASRAADRNAELLGDRAALRAFNSDIVAQVRANAGRVVRGRLAGEPMIVLTVTGARSGRPSVIPLACSRDGDRFVVIAANAALPDNPSWYHNLLAGPEVTAEADGETFQVRATEVQGAEYERLYAAQASVMPVFDEYRRRTSRHIPLLVLERIPMTPASVDP